MQLFKTNKISPEFNTIPLPPSGTNPRPCGARSRKYHAKPKRTERIKEGLKHMENFNTIVQFIQVAVAIVVVL